MPTTESDPWEVASMNELLALARSMEQESIDGYVALSARMRNMDRPDLAVVFEKLIVEEEGHLAKVDDWQEASGQPREAMIHPPEDVFDDEGASMIAPDMLSAYRAFSMAVRNEERAFAFWTYVAAHAKSDAIRNAAERMAREELGHVAKLRSERRRAFHRERRRTTDAASTNLRALETRLSEQFRHLAKVAGKQKNSKLQTLAEQARLRAESLAGTPFASAPLLEAVPDAATEQILSLCELLTDCYLDLGETATDELERDRAQSFAAELIDSLRTLRSGRRAET
ncbi:ferritin-like domain-containing protein [Sinorhizobium meliloti]|uniref:ferritin-like domain-containing protein n=1 Tax=Rhizobium meliloti TaxID=382 RepID=UPI001295B4E2|nr:ferritin family protein [Sinorhizobium meliloti]MQU92857.1 rubrerythrin family protein [Sinorhizobium meliloti]